MGVAHLQDEIKRVDPDDDASHLSSQIPPKLFDRVVFALLFRSR